MSILFSTNMTSHEYLKVNKPFRNKSMTDSIRYYFLECIKRSILFKSGKHPEDFTFNLKLTVNDSEYYDTSDPEALTRAVTELAEANRFTADLYIDGPIGDITLPMEDDTCLAIPNRVDFICGMLSILEKSDEKNFVYKNMSYYPNSSEYVYSKIDESGIHSLSEEAEWIDRDCGITGSLYGDFVTLHIIFDIDGYLPYSDRIQEILERYLMDEYDIQDFRDLREEEYALGFTDANWIVPTIQTLFDFVDEINDVLALLPTESILETSGCFMDMDTFTLVYLAGKGDQFGIRAIQY